MESIVNLSHAHLALYLLVALLIGLSKTGIHGTGMLAVPLLAIVFGGMNSSGVMLPMLCLADILAVIYYHRHASWKHLRALFPSAMAGIIIGSIAGQYVDDSAFKMIMASVIVVSVILMLWLERGHKEDVPVNPVFAHIAGATGGATSMIGNLAGSVMAVYFLSMRLPKSIFIGTTAWFFLVINLFKIPFHIFYWKTITTKSFVNNLIAFPMIAIGALLGIIIVKRVNDHQYRYFIIVMTLLAALVMVLQNYS